MKILLMNNMLSSIKSWIKFTNVFRLMNRDIIITIIIGLFVSLSEVIGIGIFLPIFQYIRLDGINIDSSGNEALWSILDNLLTSIGLSINLVTLLIIAFTLLTLRQLIRYVGVVVTTKIRERLQQETKIRLFSQFMDSSYSFQKNTLVGRFINIFTVETNKCILGLVTPLEIISNIILATLYFVMLTLISVELTFISLVVVLSSYFIVKKWINVSKQVGDKVVYINSKIGILLHERLSFSRLIKISKMEKFEKKKFSSLVDKQYGLNLYQAILEGRTNLAIEPFVIFSSLSFLYFSYTYYAMSIESIGLYFIIVMRLMPIFNSILTLFQRLKRSIGSMIIINDELTLIEKNKELDSGLTIINNPINKASFHSVGFIINDRGIKTHLLKDINLEMNRGEITAIVGETGSGKSTLIELLPKLIAPSSGDLLLDGISIEHVSTSSLRGKIAYLPQKSQIFDGTIREHIEYGNKSVNDLELQKALSLSSSSNFVSKLSDGVDTLIGSKGVKLSGGQEKKIDLARALARNPYILIFDEPCAGLDPHSEEELRLCIEAIKKNSNIIIVIVSHKLSFISNSEKIVLLNNGEVSHIGTHDELLQKSNWYKKSWKFQTV